MKIVRLEDTTLEDVKHRPRQGRFERRRLLEGETGTPENFHFQMVRTYGDFFSPRHHHNFDQVRYQIEGTFDFDRNGKMSPRIRLPSSCNSAAPAAAATCPPISSSKASPS